MPFKKGNNLAAAEGEKSTARLEGRVKPSDKNRWVRRAQSEGMKLIPWIVKVLNDECNKNLT